MKTVAVISTSVPISDRTKPFSGLSPLDLSAEDLQFIADTASYNAIVKAGKFDLTVSGYENGKLIKVRARDLLDQSANSKQPTAAA